MTACSQQDLVTKKVLNNKLSILLPKDFVLMQNEMLELKYPIAERRPTEVYTDESGAINIALNLTQNQVTIEELPEMEKALRHQFTNTSNITFNFSEIRTINGHKYIVIDFYSQAVDTKIYNLMFVTSINNRILIGTFNCTIEHFVQWKPVGLKIINSLKIISGKVY